MHNWLSKFSSIAFLGSTLALSGCNYQQVEISALAPVSGSSKPIGSKVEPKPKPLSISDQMYQQARKDYPLPKISEVSLLSVQFANYLAKQNGVIQICGGATSQSFVFQYFPKIYPLSSQKYLVEYVCSRSYNTNFSYLIYRPESPLAEVEMRNFPQDVYHRTEQGYYFLQKNGLNQPDLTVPKGEVISQTFDRYWLDESEKRIHTVSDVVAGWRLYNSNQRTLWVFSKGRGMADCGQFSRYQLKEDRFKLLEQRYQKCCSTEQECNASGYRRLPHEYPQIYP